MTQHYRITLLPGDGIGPEIMAVAVDVLQVVAQQFNLSFEFKEALIGGAALDALGEPLPADTLELCRNSEAVLLAAIGGPQWDNLP
ncbi:MAG TPA: isocitrate/isopropylmalate family dehydrogenase, partial [Candidatus Caenarcaniphilales bacterium]